MSYPQNLACPACDSPVLLVAGSRRGGTPTAFDPDARTIGGGYDTKLSADLTHVTIPGGATAHLVGHEALYRPHQRSCRAGLRVPGGKSCPSWAGYSQAAAAPRGVLPVEPPSWPVPWEGIEGTARDADDLLSLRKTAIPRRRVMVAMALVTHKLTLAAIPSAAVAQIGKRMRNPQAGDLVAEVTNARTPGSERKGFGILLASRREWLCSDEEWSGDGNDGRPSGDVFYVQYGPKPEHVARWGTDEGQIIAVLGEERKS